ncbi:GT-D fold domain-containing glycosyltransferase [Leucothrix mucor]|uniref:GT-D fold domain-containing glycosyltransferase n=1 Tax=Leucothrix mucor TaxID=45248 RepID=UPI0003B30E48|nr:GT-D fold domain-containing glycosyltransferase [Leucothrix mucor]
MSVKFNQLDDLKILLLVFIYKIFKPVINRNYTKRKILNSKNKELRKLFYTRNGKSLVVKSKKILEDNNYPETCDDYEKLLNMLRDGYSFSRFGDGEYSMLQSKRDRPVYFDKSTDFAKQKLQEVLRKPVKKHLIGLIEDDVVVNQLTFANALSIFFRTKKTGFLPRMPIFSEYRDDALALYKCPERAREHIFETGIFRNTVYERHLFLWREKDILYVTGSSQTSELYGLSINQIFKTAKSVCVIETVLENALSEHYYEILKKITSFPDLEKKMIVLSQGMAGTVLAYELCSMGYHAIDFGQPFVNYPKRLSTLLT